MNEIKNTSLKFAFVGAECEPTPEAVEVVNRKNGYVSYGEDNLFPEVLYGCYTDCSLLQSIINGLCDYVVLGGIGGGEETVGKDGSTLDDIIRKASLDYIIFGAFALQVIRNKAGNIADVRYLDVRKVRLDEDEKKVYYHPKWGNYTKSYKVYDRYSTANKYANSIFYYKNPKSRGIYGMPIWGSAIKDVFIAKEITDFHLSSIRNNFAPSAVVNFNQGVPEEEEKKRIEADLNRKFSGTKNASRLLVCFNDSPDSATTLSRLEEDNFDQKYNALRDSVRDSILTSFRASAQLFGVTTQATGFSSIEYQNSYALFRDTVVKPIQWELAKAFSILGYKVEFRDFEVQFNNSDNTEG